MDHCDNCLYARVHSSSCSVVYTWQEEKVGQDDAVVQSSLSEAVVQQQATRPVFFHLLHLSPIKVRLQHFNSFPAEEPTGGSLRKLVKYVLNERTYFITILKVFSDLNLFMGC